jgi:catechol 2,3-dioxygenase-like lactoylglutathione lyase family enzyme
MARVSEIRYVGYGVPDLIIEREFYRDVWGLREAATHAGMVYFAAEGHDEPHVVRLREAPAKRIDVIALAADTRADVDALHGRVIEAGCRVIFEPMDPAAAMAFASSRPTACRSRSPPRWRPAPSAK